MKLSIRYEAVMSVRVPEEAARQIRALADADDRPPTTLCRRWILEGLQRALKEDSTVQAAGNGHGRVTV
jgi:predicted transcriptional regulator